MTPMLPWSSLCPKPPNNKRAGRFRPARATSIQPELVGRHLLAQLGDIGFAADGEQAHLVGAIDRHADFHAAIRLVIDRKMPDFRAAYRQWECCPLIGGRV